MKWLVVTSYANGKCMFCSVTEMVIVLYRLRYRKIAARARTIDEAQASLAKQTGCVSVTFWGVPVPIKGGAVCAYS